MRLGNGSCGSPISDILAQKHKLAGGIMKTKGKHGTH